MDFDWKKTIKAVAPLIGTAIGGPFGGLATAAITGALGLPEDSNDQQIEEAIKRASPEQLVALRKADNEFKTRMKELEIKEDELVYQDIDSARKREVALGGDKTVQVLAVVIMVGFLGMCTYMIGWGIGEGVSAGLAGTVVGYVSAKAEQVCSYYFGSSKGSSDKTRMAMMK